MVGQSNKRINTYKPNYVKVSLLMDAAESHSKNGSEAIGVKLLELRSEKQLTELVREEIFALSKTAERDWKELKASSLTRTLNYNPNSAGNYRKKPIRRKKKSKKLVRRNGQRLPSKKALKRKRNVSTVATSAKKTPRIEGVQPDGVSTISTSGSQTVRFEEVRPDAVRTISPVSDTPRKKKVSIQCAKCGKNNVTHPFMKFKCVPRYPVELGRNPTLRSVIAREKKILLHEEVMERVAGKKSIKTKKYICREHEFEIVTKDKTFTYNGVSMTRSFELTVPVGAGMKSSLIPSQSSKGLGRERAVRRRLHEVANIVTPRSKRAKSSHPNLELVWDQP